MTITAVKVDQTGATHVGGVVTGGDFAQQSTEPSAITRSQIYYWSARWQEGEQESLRELEAGQGIVFDSGDDLVAWLEADDAADSDED